MLQLVGYLQYVDTVVEGIKLYCYNTEGDRSSIVSQVSCRMGMIRLELEMSKFTRGKTGGIRWQRTVDALGDHFKSLWVLTNTVFFKLLILFVISDE